MIQLSNSDYAALLGERDRLALRVAEQRDALEAAVAYVELHTGNGVRKQPPAWAMKANGEFDAQLIADRARAVVAAAD